MSIDSIVQGIIFVQSITVATIFSSKDIKWMKVGYIVMLCGQPLFFYTTWASKQWGMFALCFFYTGTAIRGYINRRHDGETKA